MKITTRLTRRLTLALAGTALVGLAAAAFAQDAKAFALVQINQQALFFNQMNAGAQAAADAAGAELLILNANNDPAAENSAVETCITEGVDGIIVVAVDVNGIMPAGGQIGDYFVNFVAENGGAAKIGIVGALNSFIRNVRQDGFEANIEGIVMAGVVDGQNIQDTAHSAAENPISANP